MKVKHRKKIEEGMVTVEAAMGISAIVAVLGLVVGAINVVRVQADLCQVARDQARGASVGEKPSESLGSSLRIPSLAVSEEYQGDWVSVTASSGAFAVGSWSIGSLHCEASTLIEPAARYDKQ